MVVKNVYYLLLNNLFRVLQEVMYELIYILYQLLILLQNRVYFFKFIYSIDISFLSLIIYHLFNNTKCIMLIIT